MDLCAVEGRQYQVRDLSCPRKRQDQSQHHSHIQVRDGVGGEVYLYTYIRLLAIATTHEHVRQVRMRVHSRISRGTFSA